MTPGTDGQQVYFEWEANEGISTSAEGEITTVNTGYSAWSAEFSEAGAASKVASDFDLTDERSGTAEYTNITTFEKVNKSNGEYNHAVNWQVGYSK